MPNPLENEGVRCEPAPGCPLCGVEGNQALAEARDRVYEAPGKWLVRECAGCRVAWLDPRPVPEEIGKLYAGYHTHAAAPVRAASSFRERIRRGFLRVAWGYPGGNVLLGAFAACVPALRDVIGGSALWLPAKPSGRLLDVGCGSGTLLRSMRELGWEVAGLEPDPEAARVAKETHGLEVRVGTLDGPEFRDRGFDAITAHHVIEHVADPAAFLREAASRLAPGGRLVVVTPNIRSLGRRRFGTAWVHWDPPRHLVLMSRRSLAAFAQRAGLRVLRLRTTGRAARLAWAQSRAIAREGRTGAGGAGPRWRALAFQLREQARLWMGREAGEELLMTAARMDDPVTAR
ncbi:MAG: class I SAM-dependent methyltransferase [Planctomycetes bacterium]|nr:class I SAM-dependent methyltransferase [Planctomycetota bacterium]